MIFTFRLVTPKSKRFIFVCASVEKLPQALVRICANKRLGYDDTLLGRRMHGQPKNKMPSLQQLIASEGIKISHQP